MGAVIVKVQRVQFFKVPCFNQQLLCLYRFGSTDLKECGIVIRNRSVTCSLINHNYIIMV